jgi:hypothetical protein
MHSAVLVDVPKLVEHPERIPLVALPPKGLILADEQQGSIRNPAQLVSAGVRGKGSGFLAHLVPRLARRADRKSSAFKLVAHISDRQLGDDVLKRRPEVASHVADDRADVRRDWLLDHVPEVMTRPFRLELSHHDCSIRGLEPLNLRSQFFHVPSSSQELQHGRPVL